MSDAQILAMLDNPLFRMVIPYHASGMLPMFAKLVGVDMYNDYTDYQNTTVRQYYDLNGNAVTELKNAKGETVKDAAQADIDNAFAAAVDAEINNPTLSRKSLLIGYTPDILLKLGVPSLPMTFNNDHIYSCAKTKQEAIAEGLYDNRKNYHGLGASGVKKIYEALKDPVAVIVSKNPQTPSTPLRSTHSVVILVEIQGNQNSLLLPVKITVQSRLGRLDVEVNEVSSAYDTDAAKYMRDAIWSEKTEGVGVFYITEKAKTLVNGGLQLPTKLQQALASSDGIVHQIPEKINMAVSTNTQSIQFTNWFGDWQNPQLSKKKVSVVVNEDGTPKVVFPR